MKIKISKSTRCESGWALLVVMSLAAAALLLVASVLTWANENAAVTARNSEYFTTAYAAESATEKVLSAMVQDDQNYGVGLVYAKTAASTYNTLVPNTADSSYWANYHFGSGSSASSGAVIVQCVSTNVTNYAGPPYSGLQYVGSDFEVIASASNATSMYGIPATVGQEVVFGQIPIFQFAIFYNDTMELGPGANMVVNGTVHGNTNIYVDPGSSVSLSFSNDVSATGTLNQTWNPLNPTPNSPVGTINYGGNHLADVNPLTLPVGTNTSSNGSNTSGSVYAIIQTPPAGESPNSEVGTNRLYNQVDLIITVSNNNAITVTSGVAVNGEATVISNGDWSKFVNTSGSFYNMRDGATVDPVNIDVGQLAQWSNTNATLRPLLAGLRGTAAASVDSIYVADQRFMSNAVVTTNTSYTTNTSMATTSYYPEAGTYLPPVATNAAVTTSATYPAAGTFLPPIQTTNLVATTSTNSPAAGTYSGTVTNNSTNYSNVATPPSPGQFTGSITTNTTQTTTSYLPGAGTYTGTISTNGFGGRRRYTYNLITGYTYSFTSYSYAAIGGYIYNGITGYTYPAVAGVSTNYTYATNYIQYAEPGVVLTNGGMLPTNGLSVVTPDPAYIVGNWNVTNSSGQGMLQTYDVADSLPSAVYADAITILSSAWNPNNSASGINSRNAAPDTVNAAILTGNVPSNGSYYSGGVENFVRFQENWSGVKFYYNGSMVEMFPSRVANSPWPGTGTVYNPPNRYWSYDTNFNNPSQLPPLVPRVTYLNRVRWFSLTNGATVF